MRNAVLAVAFSMWLGVSASAADLNGTWELTTELEHDTTADPDAPRDYCIRIALDDAGEEISAKLPNDIRLLGTEDANGVMLAYQFPKGAGAGSGEAIYHFGGGGERLDGELRAKSGDEVRMLRASLRRVSLDKIDAADATCDAPMEKYRPKPSRSRGWSVADLCQKFGISWIIGKISEKLTYKLFVPINPCGIFKEGRGFYTLGNNAPGARAYATTTAYVPINVTWKIWETCSATSYGFTFSTGDTATTWDLVDKYGDKIAPFMGLGSVIEMAAYKKLRALIGDFAVSLAYNTNSHNYSAYINVKNDAVCKSSGITQLRSVLKSSLGKISLPGMNFYDIYCGKNIDDTWNLRAAPIPVGACNSPLIITYLFGTLKVHYR